MPGPWFRRWSSRWSALWLGPPVSPWLRLAILSCAALSPWTALGGEHSLSFSNGAYAIPAIFSLPSATDGPIPAVLLLHGTASQKNEVGKLYLRLAQRLADAGIASLRIDFAGAGDSPVDHDRFSLSAATHNAQSSFDFLARHPALNKQQIVVLGFSQGGLIAQRLALQESGLLALATWSTVATDGVGSFESFFEQHYQHALDSGSAAVDFDWLEKPLVFSLQWFEEIQTQRTLSEMQTFDRPILAIAGTADATVSFQQSVNLLSQSTHAMSQLVLLAGANHVFNVLTPELEPLVSISSAERLLSVTVEWITALFEHASHQRPP